MVPSLRHTYRFSNSTNGNFSVTAGTLAGAIGGICTVVNSTLQCFASSVKIDSIDIYPSTGAQVTLNWQTGNTPFVQDTLVNDSIPSGITMTQKLTFRPAARTLAADWFAFSAVTATNTLFNMGLSASGCIIDMHVNYTLVGSIPSISRSIAVGVLGTQYYLYLDTAKDVNPVELPTTS